MAPLLEELTSYTALGPKLRKRKIDVDHMVDSMEGKVVGDLIDQVDIGRTPKNFAARVVFAATLVASEVSCVVCASCLGRRS